MKIAVFKHSRELTDTYLRQLSALGGDTEMPGVAEQGYPDLNRHA